MKFMMSIHHVFFIVIFLFSFYVRNKVVHSQITSSSSLPSFPPANTNIVASISSQSQPLPPYIDFVPPNLTPPITCASIINNVNEYCGNSGSWNHDAASNQLTTSCPTSQSPTTCLTTSTSRGWMEELRGNYRIYGNNVHFQSNVDISNQNRPISLGFQTGRLTNFIVSSNAMNPFLSSTYARLDQPRGCWRPNDTDIIEPFFQVDMLMNYTVTHIAVQGSPLDGDDSAVYDFRLQYTTLDSPIPIDYPTIFSRIPRDGNQTIVHELNPPIAARIVRLRIVRCADAGCCLRFDLFGFYPGILLTTRDSPVTLPSTAYSTSDSSLSAAVNVAWDNRGWFTTNTGQNVEIRFPAPVDPAKNSIKTIGSIYLGAAVDRACYTTRLSIQYNLNGQWIFYTGTNTNGSTFTFNGLSSPTDIIRIDLPVPITARIIRFYPLSFIGGCAALRLDLQVVPINAIVDSTLQSIGPFGYTDYSLRLGYAHIRFTQSIVFRFIDQWNHYEFRMFKGQSGNLALYYERPWRLNVKTTSPASSIVYTSSSRTIRWSSGFVQTGTNLAVLFDNDTSTYLTTTPTDRPGLTFSWSNPLTITTVTFTNGPFPVERAQLLMNRNDGAATPTSIICLSSETLDVFVPYVAPYANFTFNCYNNTVRFLYLQSLSFTGLNKGWNISISELDIRGPTQQSFVSLIKRVGGVATELARLDTNYIPSSTFHLDAYGSNLTLYATTREMPIFKISVNDSTFPRGTIGFGAHMINSYGLTQDEFARFTSIRLAIPEVIFSDTAYSETVLPATWTQQLRLISPGLSALQISAETNVGCCVHLFAQQNSMVRFDSAISTNVLSTSFNTSILLSNLPVNTNYYISAYLASTQGLPTIDTPVTITFRQISVPVTNIVIPGILTGLSVIFDRWTLLRLTSAAFYDWCDLTFTLNADSFNTTIAPYPLLIVGRSNVAPTHNTWDSQASSISPGRYYLRLSSLSTSTVYWFGFYGASSFRTSYNFNVSIVPITPTITLVTPQTAPTSGGRFTISGNNFGSYVDTLSQVVLSNKNCSIVSNSWTVQSASSSSRVIAQCPAGQGTETMQIYNSFGQLSNGFTITYIPPTIQSLQPNIGPCVGNIPLTLNGVSFGVAPTVIVNNQTVDIIFANHSCIIFNMPAGQGLGIPVIVRSSGLTSNSVLLNYLAPTIANIIPSVSPTIGNINITINGNNLGMTSPPTVGFGQSTCTVVLYNSSNVVCTISPGEGSNLIPRIAAAGQVAATGLSFSYLPPIITDIQPPLVSTASGSIVTVSGSNFGISRPSATIVGRNCLVRNFSQSQLIIELPAVQGLNLSVRVVVASQQSNSFDIASMPPNITQLLPATISTAGGNILTIRGNNFGVSGLVSINSLICPFVFWNHTEIRCTTRSGQGTNSIVNVAVESQRSNDALISYTPPLITRISPNSSSTLGGAIMLLTGTNFGSDGSITIGNLSCSSFPGAIYNHTNAQCRIPSGASVNLPVVITVGDQSSSNNNPNAIFNYSRPIINSLTPRSGGTEGGYKLTISGSNFFTSGIVRLGSQLTCSYEAREYTHTSIACMVPIGFGSDLSVSVQVGNQISNSFSFSYIDPIITSITPNQIDTIGALLTIRGSSFDVSPGTVMIRSSSNSNNNNNSCAIQGWDHTLILCMAPSGVGTNNVTVTTLRNRSTTTIAGLVYNPPVIDIVQPDLFTTRGQVLATITGNNFGSTGRVLFDNNDCLVNSTLYTGTSYDHTRIVCLVPSGAGLNRPVTIITGPIISKNTKSINRLAPQIAQILPTSGASEGGHLLTLIGSNFFTQNGSLLIDTTPCPIQSQDHDMVICRVPSLTNGIKQITFTIAGQISNGISYSVDDPSIIDVQPRLIPTTGAVITIIGRSFGPTPTATIDKNTNCPIFTTNPSRYNHTYLECVVSPGTGTQLSVLVSSIYQVSTAQSFLISYLPPTISNFVSTLPGQKLPTPGNVAIFIQGNNFGLSTLGLSVTFNSISSAIQTVNHTQIVTILPAGSGINLPIQVTVGGQSSNIISYSYDRPTITSIEPTTSVTNPNNLILTILGSSFGPSGGSVTVGGRPCFTANFVYGHHRIHCFIPAGDGLNQLVQVQTISGASQELFYVNYNAPVIQSISPSIVPTSGPFSITIQGLNFGRTGIVTVANNLAPLISWSHTRAVVQTPEGEGRNQIVMLNVSNQIAFSNIDYQVPILYSINPTSAPTSETTILTIQGEQFGLNPQVSIVSNVAPRMLSCPIQSSSHTSILCQLPEYAGPVTIFVTTAGQVSGNLTFNYIGPTITRVSGCQDQLTATRRCKWVGNESITISGINFGPFNFPVDVTIDGQPCTNVQHLINTQIICNTPAGSGTLLPVKITVAGRSHTANLLSYVSPEIDSVIANMQQQIVTIIGRSFGDNSANMTVRYGPPSTIITSPVTPYTVAANYQMYACNVQLGNDTHIICSLQSGASGSQLKFQVSIPIASLNNRIIFSLPSNDSITYLPPNFINATIRRTFSSPLGVTSILGDASLGETLVFNVQNVDSNVQNIRLYYGMPEQKKSYRCLNLNLVTLPGNIQSISCITDRGVGGPYVFQLISNNQPGPESTDTYQYPTPPSLNSIAGCNANPDNTNMTVGCPTEGGVTLTLYGDKFTNSTKVTIGEALCLNFIAISQQLATCLLPSYVGLELPILLTSGSLAATPVRLISYAVPTITKVSGCEISLDDPSATINCPRIGGTIITIDGINFASSSAIVIVAGKQCLNVTHDKQSLHRRLTCQLPPLTGLDREVLVIQGRGSVSNNTGKISFLPCPVGQYSVAGTIDCALCQPGTYTDNIGSVNCKTCLPGTIAPNAGSSSCIACNAGSFSQDGLTCRECTSGRYTNVAGQSSCFDCPIGRYIANNGSSFCMDCNAGRFTSTLASTQCQLCSAGTISPLPGGIICQPCSSGRYSDPNISVENCLLCPLGQYASLAGSINCQPAPLGTFVNAFGQSEARECPSGTYADTTGLSTCKKCPIGRFSVKQDGLNIGPTSCQLCEAGFYSNSEGQTSCLACPRGTYQSDSGQSTCPACLAGSFQASSGRSSCDACSAGHFSPIGSAVCYDCGIGRYSERANSSNCVDCQPGRYQPSIGKSTCLSCAINTFTSLPAQTVCVPCPDGTTTSMAGSSSCSTCTSGRFSFFNLTIAECAACQPGSYAANSLQNQCRQCPLGTFTSSFGSSTCQACEQGAYSNIVGASRCEACSVGTIASATGSYSCTQCPAGKSQSSTGRSSCNDCQVGRYSFQSGSATCMECPNGQYSDTTGQSSCIDCSGGTYNNQTGASQCQQCSIGSFQASSGSQTCEICPTGRFGRLPGRLSCTTCSLGSYSDNLGSSGCKLCQPGTFTNQDGSIGCSTCPTGTYSSDAGSTSCLPCSVGSFSNLAGQSTCQTCPAGTVQPSAQSSSCLSCSPGKYISTEGQTQCNDCPAGTFSSTSGSSRCEVCPVGKYSFNSGSISCILALPGYYVDKVGQVSQTTCPAGRFSATEGSENCQACSPGTYSDRTGSSVCGKCQVGTASSSDGAITCDSCRSGFYADKTGQSSCSICEAGTSSRSGAATCSSCDAGRFSSSPGSPVCTDCGSGTFQSQSGSSSCTSCPAGSYMPSSGATICLECASGSFSSVTGSFTCNLCNEGTFSPSKGLTSCLACPYGHSQSFKGSSTCNECNAGFFSPTTGQADCLACDIGTYTSSTGQSSCTQCNPGTYNDQIAQTTCRQCSAGFYNSFFGQARCLACESGFYSDTEGRASCTACDVGHYSVKRAIMINDVEVYFGATICSNCQAGRFQSETGQTGCLACDVGTFGNVTGLSSCRKCPVGRYNDQIEQQRCKTCSSGEYNANEGQVRCESCQSGTYSSANQASSCDICFPGQFQSLSAQTTCLGCAPGRYQDGYRSNQCKICPPGTFSNVTGSTVCQSCSPGYYNDRNGATICMACEAGTYQFNPGQSSCLACAAGSYSNTTASTGCELCIAGKYQSNIRNTTCYDCELGTYTSGNGQKECLRCPAGTYLDEIGKTICKGCTIGRYQSATGAVECIDCQLGRFVSVSKAEICDLCPEGHFSNTTGSGNCLECDIGKYQNLQGRSTCTDCRPGTYNTGRALKECTPCETGRFTSFNGSFTCDDCQAGYYQSQIGSSSCSLCPEGKFNTFPKQDQCKDCDVGTYQNETGSLGCKLCTSGTYADIIGLRSCKPCALGTAGSAEGATSCASCTPGSYSNITGLTQCLSCDIGRYSAIFGSQECLACEPGRFTSTPAKSVCSYCDVGRFNDEYGATGCSLCLSGSFQNVTGGSSCFECPSGRFSDQPGKQFCDECKAGTYSNVTGLIQCIRCPPGRSRLLQGAIECDVCTEGQYQPSSGASACQDCEPGRYTALNETTFCQGCPAGFYQPFFGKAACLPCREGQYSEGNNPSCSLCPAGRFTNETGQNICQPCQPGTYSNTPGSSVCKSCERGRFSDGLSASSCQNCQSGRYSNVTGLSVCIDCDIGSAQVAEGQRSCSLCEPGTFADRKRSDICTKCRPGTFNADYGQSICKPCPAGTQQKSEGFSYCELCERGKYSQGNQPTCTKCPNTQIAPYRGSESCQDCDTNAAANPDNTRCLCNSGFAAKISPQRINYTEIANMTLSRDDKLRYYCERCPSGAQCDTNGTIWDEMIPLPGYYFTKDLNNFTQAAQGSTDGTVVVSSGNLQFYRCLFEFHCLGGANNTCADNREGVLCGTCQKNYILGVDGKCKLCPTKGSSVAFFVFITLLVIAAFCLQLWIILRSSRDDLNAERSSERRKRVSLNLGNSASSSTGAEEFLDFNFSSNPMQQNQQHQTNDDNNKFNNQLSLFNKTDGSNNKDELSNVIQNQDEDTDGNYITLNYLKNQPPRRRKMLLEKVNRYDMMIDSHSAPVPRSNLTFKMKILISFSQIVVNLVVGLEIRWPEQFKRIMNWLNPLNLDFVTLSSVGCVTDTTFYLKLIVYSLVPVIVLMALTCIYLIPMATYYTLRRPDPVERKLVRRKFWKMLCYILFLIYPGVSSTILRTFICKNIQGVSYLVSDLRLICYTSQWYKFAYVAAAMIIVYPILIPAFFYFMLRRYRHRLNEPGVKAELGFIYDAYSREIWWFELLDMAHKLTLSALTGFLPFNLQMAFSLIISGLYMIIILSLKPYMRKSDDRLHLLAQTELFLIILAGNVFNQYETIDPVTEGFMTFILVVIVLAFNAYFISQTVTYVRKFLLKFSHRREQRLEEERLKKAGPVMTMERTLEAVILKRKLDDQNAVDENTTNNNNNSKRTMLKSPAIAAAAVRRSSPNEIELAPTPKS